MRRWAQSPGQIVIIERDACIRPYNHFGEVYQAGYPKLLFAYAIKDSAVRRTGVVAAKDEIIKNDSGV